MRHARAEDLDRVDGLLDRLRTIDGLKERSRGTFYVRSRAFLHFHEHDGEIICDVRLDPGAADFERRTVTSAAAQRTLVSDVRRALAVG
jgi:N-acetylglutamate synthase-like GNAT family acetyltransferase